MVGSDVVGIGVVLLGMAVPLARQWLRLWFRCLYLHAASAMPAGSRIKERRPDGSQVTITVGGTIRKSPDE